MQNQIRRVGGKKETGKPPLNTTGVIEAQRKGKHKKQEEGQHSKQGGKKQGKHTRPTWEKERKRV